MMVQRPRAHYRYSNWSIILDCQILGAWKSAVAIWAAQKYAVDGQILVAQSFPTTLTRDFFQNHVAFLIVEGAWEDLGTIMGR